MPYESSYDAGLKPFNHDKDRGKWSSPQDFLFACLGHAFKLDAVFVLPLYVFDEFGYMFIFPYMFVLAVCVVPIVLMQSFLGQFSGTGFISAFRVSPLFKGIGYVSLIVNFISLTYYSIFGAIPLLYLLQTLRITIPWSCEGAKEWMKYNTSQSVSICDLSNSTSMNVTERFTILVPSFEYFKQHLNLFDKNYPKESYSWFMLFCTFLILCAAGGVLINSFELIAKFLRYSCMAVLGLIGICLLRFIFLPGATHVFLGFFVKPHVNYFETWLTIPIVAISVLGPGWGTIITMASYNQFKTDIYKYSWILCLSHLVVITGLTFITLFMNAFLATLNPSDLFYPYTEHQLYDLLMVPSALTLTELPHMWTILFFSMLILASINLVVVQLQSMLTSLFDEFELLRPLKREVTIGSLCVLGLFAIFFSSIHGITAFEILIGFQALMQVILNMLLLLVVLWIYGRERFQRDLKFMINITYSTWMINVMRFVTPLCLLCGFLVGLIFIFSSYDEYTEVTYTVMFLISVMMWMSIPAYCGYTISQMTGMLGLRLRRSLRPSDWYPADPQEKARYEEMFNASTDISHPLAEEDTLDE